MEGVKIKTVSGIRGQIKKALRTPNGSFRATFEDRILSSDLVFVPVWYRVKVPHYYNQIFSMLQHNKKNWEGMKTVGSLRHDRSVSLLPKQESCYKVIARPPLKYSGLKISHKLHMYLPFSSKPKSKVNKNPRKAVLLEFEDKSVENLLAALRNVHRKNFKN